MGRCHTEGYRYRLPAHRQRSTAAQHSRKGLLAAWQQLSSRAIPELATASCDPPVGMCCCALTAGARIDSGEGCSIRATAIAYDYPVDPRQCATKNESDKRKTHLFSGSKPSECGQALFHQATPRQGPSRAPPGKNVAPLP